MSESQPLELSSARMKDLEPLTLRQSLTRRATLSLEDVVKVFTPTSAIADPVRFAGRIKQVEQITSALLSPDADIIVFGERGTGKTSLAHMLEAVAAGDYQLLDYYGLRRHLESLGRIPLTRTRSTFTVIWVPGFGQSLEDTIYSALTRRADSRSGPGLLYYLPDEASQIEIGEKIGFDKVFTGESSVKQVIIRPQPRSIKQGFELATQRFARANPGKEILIIIDEFETVQNRAEISQYLKSASARFALIGIGATTLELLGEHASVARSTYGITLPPMSEQELIEILLIGRYILSQLFQYHDDAVRCIARLANGSPFWCHYLAQGVLENKMESAGGWLRFQDSRLPLLITEEDVHQLVTALPTRADCDLYETALSQSVMGDDINKRVLQVLAAQSSSLISTAKLSEPFATEGINERLWRDTVEGFLALPGVFQENGRIRDVVQFSFIDPNFRRYILLRCAKLNKAH
jgi:Cdc6-like AAA superfamily ATPase